MPTILNMVGWRTRKNSDGVAYVFLSDGETEAASLTFRQIDERARAIAAVLQQCGQQGDRVLLVYAPGPDFITGFLGCLFAGMVAVPVYPPDPTRLHKTLPRFRAVLGDAQCRVVLTTSDIGALADGLAAMVPEAASLSWIATDKIDLAAADSWVEPLVSDLDTAMLQYTSGSTSMPKGVMISNRNLMHNEQLIRSLARHNEATIGVGWLPPYHDMGLIGLLLQPLYSGGRCYFMPPMAFLRRPLAWLKGISKYRGTSTAAPNFAFELCCRKATPADLAGLDLSSWEVVFNGAEPVRAETLDRFVETFGPCGFRREVFLPCYGMAETTLIVTGVARGTVAARIVVDAHELARGRAVFVEPDAPRAKVLVSCGPPLGDTVLRIVDPATKQVLREGEVGEVWVRSRSVAAGYWNRGADVNSVFAGQLDGDAEPYLRTSDLGLLWKGELYLCGRIKDLIIIRGRNLYPDDLERTVEGAAAGIRPGCIAAVGVDVAHEERLVIVAELDVKRGAPAEVVPAVRGAISRDHDVQVHDVVLLAPGTLPKTTSGKVQRHACAAGYLTEEWSGGRLA